MDPSYRSGREIPAVDIGFGKDLFRYVKGDVNVGMFPARQVELKLYKLAVYETGGHFDWHRDSTHSDKHHATLLVALNTFWKGGDLVLRRNDIETHVDLRPKSGDTEDSDEPILQAVAFFTDTEHHVEPVTEGIRIVLQYDIEIIEGEDEEEEYYEGWLHKSTMVTPFILHLKVSHNQLQTRLPWRRFLKSSKNHINQVSKRSVLPCNTCIARRASAPSI